MDQRLGQPNPVSRLRRKAKLVAAIAVVVLCWTAWQWIRSPRLTLVNRLNEPVRVTMTFVGSATQTYQLAAGDKASLSLQRGVQHHLDVEATGPRMGIARATVGVGESQDIDVAVVPPGRIEIASTPR